MWAMLLAIDCELEWALTWLAMHGDAWMKKTGKEHTQDDGLGTWYKSRFSAHILLLFTHIITYSNVNLSYLKNIWLSNFEYWISISNMVTVKKPDNKRSCIDPHFSLCKGHHIQLTLKEALYRLLKAHIFTLVGTLDSLPQWLNE